ncbi:lipopolysaccharide biosynthesis protein [Thalassotalea sp. HSM 43]|uniref:lipopolysaccharide biosynthesis protein n=1 Tax=Thalassotalea sp. HSM 43 TaxID=2552945 RepID=UPI001080DDF8|nr:lipopolysaccharide biosynthesis protein [Thalassotalea sp. HSM 43]QBY03132.1 lipopolysaccharide biosynthesis protein [Thalassotalea sp. HSM 43]
MNDLKSKSLNAFAWDFLGKLSTQGMSFIVTIFLARMLAPSDFGLIAMIMVVIGIAQVFTDIGLGSALIQRRKVLPVHYSSVFFFNILIACILSFVFYISADYIAQFYEQNKLVPLVQVLSVLFVLNAFSSVQNTKLRKELNYRLLTKVNFISSFLSGVVGISLALNGAGVWSLVYQVISQSIFYNLVIWSVSSWFPKLNFSFKALRQLWSFGFRMFLAGLLEAIFTRIDYLLIGKLLPVATLGYFQRAKQFNSLVIQYSSGSLMSVMFPVLSKVQNDLARYQNIVVKSLNILCFIVFILLGGLYVTANEIVLFLFSDKWLPSVIYLKLLALSGFGYPISALLVNVLSSRGNSKDFLRLEMLKKSLHTLNFFNLFYNGIEFYLYGLVVVSFLSVSLNILFASKETGIKITKFLKPIVIQFSICIVCTLCTLYAFYLVEGSLILNFFTKIILFTTMFIGINLLFKTASLIEIKLFVKPIIQKRISN